MREIVASLVASSTLMLFVAGILWFFRSAISTWLSSGIQHQYDAKIEQIRSDLQREETSLEQKYIKETEVAKAIRGGALSGLLNRQNVLDQRRVEAIDQLWVGVIALNRYRFTSDLMKSLDFSKASTLAANDPRVREVFSTIGQPLTKEKQIDNSPELARPYVTPVVWSLFAAYRSIIMYAYLKLQLLQAGGEKNIVDQDQVKQLILKVLPDHGGFLEEYGIDACHHLLDRVEEMILREIQEMLSGTASDQYSVEQAAEILRLADNVMVQTRQADTRPTAG